MEVYHEQVSGVTAITPTGRIDSNTSKQLEDQIERIVTADSMPLVIDLSGVDYISSAGLRIILALAKRSQAAQGRLALHGLKPNIKEVFEISGFSTILAIYDSRDSAVAAVTA